MLKKTMSPPSVGSNSGGNCARAQEDKGSRPIQGRSRRAIPGFIRDVRKAEIAKRRPINTFTCAELEEEDTESQKASQLARRILKLNF